MRYLMYLLGVKSRFVSRALSLPIGKILLCTFLFLALASASRAQVVINELAASNDSSVENGGKFPDWLELYNNSGGTVNLGAMSLFMTNPGSSVIFTFPAVNILLNPHQFLVVWCDSDTNTPGFHTGFNLPKSSGGTLYLRTPGGGANLDQVTFGLQLTDLTVGRVPDGVGGFQLTIPTPALPNQTQPVGS